MIRPLIGFHLPRTMNLLSRPRLISHIREGDKESPSDREPSVPANLIAASCFIYLTTENKAIGT